jgi:hypothetical protein
VSGKITNNLRVHPRDGLKLSRPVVAKVRPRQPCSIMLLPLSRHAQRAGRGFRCGNGRSSWHGSQRQVDFSRKAAEECSPGREPWGESRKYSPSGAKGSASSDLVNQPTRNRGIRIDPPVAQKRPIPANVFQRLQINFAHENLFFVMRTLRNYSPERVTQE